MSLEPPSRKARASRLRREGVDRRRQVSGRARERQDRSIDSGGCELAEPFALRLDGAEQERLANERLRRELQRALAVARVPGLDKRLDLVAAAEPAEEVGVHRYRRVGDERALRQGERLVLGTVDGEE